MKISYLVSAFILSASIGAGEPTLYVCKQRVTGTTAFQDFPCEKDKTDKGYETRMPKGNVLASNDTSGQGVPMGYWQSRIPKPTHLENPVENIRLPELNKVPNLTGSDFIKRENTAN